MSTMDVRDEDVIDNNATNIDGAHHGDAGTGGVMGAVGGAVVGALAGGPLGAVVGAIAGGVASAAGVAAVDRHDHDNSPGDTNAYGETNARTYGDATITHPVALADDGIEDEVTDRTLIRNASDGSQL